MKKLISLLMCLALMLGVIAPCAVSAEAAEGIDNNTAGNATLIENGAITGVLDYAEDVDWYKFESTQDYFVLTFAMNDQFLGQSSGNGWNVYIYDSAVNVNDPLLSATITNSGTFPIMALADTIYVKVVTNDTYHSRHAAGIAYDITITQTTDAYWESEWNDDSKTANVIESDKTYGGNTFYAEDVDWFKVTTSNYFTVDFALHETSFGESANNGWHITIYDADVEHLYDFTVANNGTSIIIPYKGTVYVKVQAADTYHSRCPGRGIYYSLKVNSYTDAKWEQEYNNESTTANVIKQGEVYTGNIFYYEDVDYFKFKSTTDAFKLNFSISLDEVPVEAINSGWKISLYAQVSGELLNTYTVSSVGSFESIPFAYEKGKYYYVKVQAADSWHSRAVRPYPYHISVQDATNGKKWEVEKNTEGVSSATALADSQTRYGNLNYAEDQDYFKLTIPTGGTIDIKFAREDSDTARYGYSVKLINASGATVSSNSATGISAKFTKIAVSKGTYYLIVQAVDTYYTRVASSDIIYNVSYTLAPTTPSVKSVVPGDKAIKLTWGKRSDVTGYEIQYATDSAYKTAKTKKITKNSTVTATLTGLTAKKTYYVRVRTYTTTSGKTYYSAWASKSVKTQVTAPTLKTVTAATKSFKAAWTKNSNATGYIIEYSTSSSFKSSKTEKVTSAATLNKTIKSLSAKKTYYVRVRAYVTLDKTYYSAWSSVKTVKTK